MTTTCPACETEKSEQNMTDSYGGVCKTCADGIDESRARDGHYTWRHPARNKGA